MNLESLTWRFTALRTRVHVHPFFWILAILFASMWARGASGGEAWLRTLLGVVLVFAGVLVHELGHALAGRHFGRSPSIVLGGWGGVTSWQAGGPLLTVWQHVWISLAGPLVGIVLGGGALLLQAFAWPRPGPFAEWAFGAFVFVNLGWAVFNLLPVLPLDGGHIVQALAIGRWGPKGNEGTHWLSLLGAVMLAVVGVFVGSIYLVVLFAFLAYRSVQLLRRMGARNPLRSREATERADVLRGHGGADDGDADDDEDRPRWLH